MIGLGSAHVRYWPATTSRRRSRPPASTTETRRTHDPRAPASLARADRSTGSASVALRVEYVPISAAKTACVPHSANATTRAWGNAACSPLFTPGRPKNAVFAVVSATSRHVPSIATSRRPASHTPGVVAVAIGLATRANNAANGSDPSRARAWKIADFDGNLRLPTPRPTTAHRSAAPARPHRSPRSTAPSRSRSTPSPAPATTDAAARSAPPRRSPHRPAPAGTPASAPPPTPDPTTDDPTPASSIQHEACPQTTPL